MSKKVRLSRIYPHPPERVWRALTDREALEEWLLPGDFEPRLGHRFRFQPGRGLPETAGADCEVVEIEEARRLAYTWRQDAEEEPGLVTWTLEPVAEGTLLELVHEPPRDPQATAQMSLLGREWEWRLCVTLPTVLSRRYILNPERRGGGTKSPRAERSSKKTLTFWR
jgi:uncharacterized protein YndB with AHSA1/START domain